MVAFARYLRQTTIEADAFRMSSLELAYLLMYSPILQYMVISEARKDEPDAESTLIVIPENRYTAPPLKEGCGFKTPATGTVTDVYGKGEGLTPVSVLEEQQEESNWLIWAGVALGTIGAFAFASTFMKKKRARA